MSNNNQHKQDVIEYSVNICHTLTLASMYVLDTLIAFSVQIETIKRPQKVSRIISEKILFFE